jgi:hypothetical protein
MTLEHDPQVVLRTELELNIRKAVRIIENEPMNWLLAHGTVVDSAPMPITRMQINGDRGGNPLELFFGKGVIARHTDENGVKLSYVGNHQFHECRVMKNQQTNHGWGVAFYDTDGKALIISKAGSFEYQEDGKLMLEMYGIKI